MIHFWMIIQLPILDNLYDPLLDGYTNDRKRLCNPQQLTATEIRWLIRLLEGEQLDVFAKMIDRLGKGSERLVPGRFLVNCPTVLQCVECSRFVHYRNLDKLLHFICDCVL